MHSPAGHLVPAGGRTWSRQEGRGLPTPGQGHSGAARLPDVSDCDSCDMMVLHAAVCPGQAL